MHNNSHNTSNNNTSDSFRKQKRSNEKSPCAIYSYFDRTPGDNNDNKSFNGALNNYQSDKSFERHSSEYNCENDDWDKELLLKEMYIKNQTPTSYLHIKRKLSVDDLVQDDMTHNNTTEIDLLPNNVPIVHVHKYVKVGPSDTDVTELKGYFKDEGHGDDAMD